jgi:predicted enzyme related to lactoylglutathione lyase
MHFYTELLGAEIEVAKASDVEYPMLKKDGRSHAGFFKKDHDDVPSHWYPYIEVGDVDATVEQAKSRGSDVYHGPISMADIRFAVLGDPQRATFGVLSSPNDAPTGLFVWDELHAADVGAAKSYYRELFGWTASSFMEGLRRLQRRRDDGRRLDAEERGHAGGRVDLVHRRRRHRRGDRPCTGARGERDARADDDGERRSLLGAGRPDRRRLRPAQERRQLAEALRDVGPALEAGAAGAAVVDQLDRTVRHQPE